MSDRPEIHYFRLIKEGEEGKLFPMCEHHRNTLKVRPGWELEQIGCGVTGRPRCHYCEQIDG